MSAEFVPVATLGEIAPGTAKTVVVDRREIAVFNIDGTFYAIENTCPHQGGPLAEGWLDGATVTCPWHAWCFKLDDGSMTLGDFASVDAFDVRIEGTTIAISRTPKSAV